jgi:hypothetical protein
MHPVEVHPEMEGFSLPRMDRRMKSKNCWYQDLKTTTETLEEKAASEAFINHKFHVDYAGVTRGLPR